MIVDDLRPAIGAYDYPGMHTPNMDRLAAEGTLFERAYVQVPLCSPSRGTIFTGRRPASTTMYQFDTDFRMDAVNGAEWVTRELRLMPTRGAEPLCDFPERGLAFVYHCFPTPPSRRAPYSRQAARWCDVSC